MQDNNEKLEEAKRLIRENLETCCRELLEWHDSGILRDGKVREIARLCSFAGSSALSLAEGLIERAAIEHVCNI